MDIYNILCKLLCEDGVSCFENSFSEYVKELLLPYCKNVYIDKFQNVIGHIPSKNKNAKKLLIDAHLDKIGLMVKKIDKNGFLEFEKVGGIDEKILPSQEVTVFGSKKLNGVIGAMPPHLKQKDEKEDKLLIDIGLKNSQAEKYVQVGDFISLKNSPVRLLNNRVTSASLDNRAGMTAVINFLDKIKNIDIPYDIYVSFSSMEESGLLGTPSATLEIMPDISVVVDVTFGKHRETEERAGTFSLSSGAIIFRGPDVSNKGSLKLIDVAKKYNIPFDIEVSGSSSGTNATVIQTTGKGTKSYLISIPLKYMHQTVEMVSLDDICAVSDLLYFATLEEAFND